MKKIELEILAKDIIEGNYFDMYECPITRALRRAGYPDLKEGGGTIDGTMDGPYLSMNTPRELSAKVLGMFTFLNKIPFPSNAPLEPSDFKYTLEVDDGDLKEIVDL